MPPRTNALGLTRDDYKRRKSTLCPGCGHDSISNQIISMAFDLNLDQRKMVTFSGIGCSSKSLAYFLGGAHAFNGIHGRMPSVASGAMVANRDLLALGVSGDGDTGSIGLGQFKHMLRRNIPMVYIIENNGVYALTKGQFSATADEGQILKYYGKNELPAIDLALEAIVSGCTFVARSFSGDAKQVQTLLKAAIRHKGTAVIDIISPCLTFNSGPTSNKSYEYGKQHETPLHEIDFMPEGVIVEREEITIGDYAEGQIIDVELHDGSLIRLKKLERDYDPRSRSQALAVLDEAQREQLFLTGLIYYEEPRPTLVETLHLVDTPLSRLPEERLRPSRESLEDVLANFR